MQALYAYTMSDKKHHPEDQPATGNPILPFLSK